MRVLSASVPVKAPSGFALAFLNTYVRDLARGAAEAVLPLRYVITQLAGLTLERDVTAQITYEAQPADAAPIVTIAWRPEGTALFPSFAGNLTAETAGDRACRLTITGSYDPPGGMVGRLFDALIGVRIARGTVLNLLAKFRDAIETDYRKRMNYGD